MFNYFQDNNETKKEEKVPEVVVVKLKVKEQYSTANVLSADEVDSAKSMYADFFQYLMTFRIEGFERSERLVRERAAAENELEAFAFDASLLLEEAEFAAFMSEEDQKKLREEVVRVRSWLEDETSAETKTGEFKENHKKIDDLVRPVKLRHKENKVCYPFFHVLCLIFRPVPKP